MSKESVLVRVPATVLAGLTVGMCVAHLQHIRVPTI